MSYRELSPNIRTCIRAILKRLGINYNLSPKKIRRSDGREVTIKVANITIDHLKEALKRQKALLLIDDGGYYYTKFNSIGNIRNYIRMMESK
jgi:uncharacterized protein YlxP (DUF503 family)